MYYLNISLYWLLRNKEIILIWQEEMLPFDFKEWNNNNNNNNNNNININNYNT